MKTCKEGTSSGQLKGLPVTPDLPGFVAHHHCPFVLRLCPAFVVAFYQRICPRLITGNQGTDASKYVGGGVEVFTRLHLPRPDSSTLSTGISTCTVSCFTLALCLVIIARVKLYNA